MVGQAHCGKLKGAMVLILKSLLNKDFVQTKGVASSYERKCPLTKN